MSRQGGGRGGGADFGGNNATLSFGKMSVGIARYFFGGFLKLSPHFLSIFT